MSPLKKGPHLSKLEHVALRFTEWVGSISSLIVHTILFVASFLLIALGVNTETVLLVLTTVVSLEAIYLAIFIQMTVNRNTQSLEEVEEDIDEIQEDIEGVEKDIDEIQKDVDEIQEDVDEMTEEEKLEVAEDEKTQQILGTIETGLQKLMKDIEELRQRQK